METVFRLLILDPLGFLIACIAAAITAAAITSGPIDDFRHLEIFLFNAGSLIYIFGVFSFGPASFFIAVSEIFSVRSILYWLLVGVALAALGCLFLAAQTDEAVTGPRIALLSGVGALGGLVYWTIAGREAGRRPTDRDTENHHQPADAGNQRTASDD